jgi:acyl carrier protein
MTMMEYAARRSDDTRPSTATDAESVQEWLVNYLSNLLDLREQDVDRTVSFQSFGLDSAATVGLTGDLSDWIGWKVDPTLAYDFPNIQALSAELSREAKARAG